MDGLWATGERTKHQFPNTKLQRKPGIEIPKTKLQTPKKSQVPSSKPRPALRAWNLELLWSLEFGALIGEVHPEGVLRGEMASESRPSASAREIAPTSSRSLWELITGTFRISLASRTGSTS